VQRNSHPLSALLEQENLEVNFTGFDQEILVRYYSIPKRTGNEQQQSIALFIP